MWVASSNIAERLELCRREVGAVLRRLPKLAVPDTCLVCDELVAVHGGCCPGCWREIRFIRPPVCPVMGSPFPLELEAGTLSLEAISDPPPFKRLRAAVVYDGPARRLVSAFKYSDRLDLAPWIARWMAVAGKELLEEADMIIPVPLHRSRLRGRRFNQSSELARIITRSHDIDFYPDLLTRKRATRQQVGLSEQARERNVAGAFRVPDTGKVALSGRRVVLIDDVYTTGATTRSATRSLLRGGASQVDVLVFAKVETAIL